jgi:hypothetical protein
LFFTGQQQATLQMSTIAIQEPFAEIPFRLEEDDLFKRNVSYSSTKGYFTLQAGFFSFQIMILLHWMNYVAAAAAAAHELIGFSISTTLFPLAEKNSRNVECFWRRVSIVQNT